MSNRDQQLPDTRELVTKAAQEIEASRTISPTPPGQNSRAPSNNEGHIEAINQVFALFRLNYHNQYYAAYPDPEQVKQIKKLWLDSLAEYPVEQILKGAKYAIEHSEYLPTLHRMLDCCRETLTEFGLPTARDAYLEACLAGTPKSAQSWSHPAVYLAGKDADWFFLANNPEQSTWPVFRQHYERYCTCALRGETLQVPEPEALEYDSGEALSAEEQQERLKALREATGL